MFFRIAMKLCVLSTPVPYLEGHSCTFCKLWGQTRTTHKKTKVWRCRMPPLCFELGTSGISDLDLERCYHYTGEGEPFMVESGLIFILHLSQKTSLMNVSFTCQLVWIWIVLLLKSLYRSGGGSPGWGGPPCGEPRQPAASRVQPRVQLQQVLFISSFFCP